MRKDPNYRKHPAWFIKCRDCGARAFSMCKTPSDCAAWTPSKYSDVLLPFHACRIRRGLGARKRRGSMPTFERCSSCLTKGVDAVDASLVKEGQICVQCRNGISQIVSMCIDHGWHPQCSACGVVGIDGRPSADGRWVCASCVYEEKAPKQRGLRFLAANQLDLMENRKD